MNRDETKNRPVVPPPDGYPSWLAYAVATLDTRSLLNEHAFGLQPQWDQAITVDQMREAAAAELRVIEGCWTEMERCWSGEIDTTPPRPATPTPPLKEP